MPASGLAPSAPNDLAQAFVDLACELALVVDAQGVVCHLAGRPGLPRLVWQDRLWRDLVAGDSRLKAEALLAEAVDPLGPGLAGRRELNLDVVPLLPMVFAALRLGAQGKVLVVGHDLAPATVLQQRFLRAQRELEQTYQDALRRLGGEAAPPPDDGLPGVGRVPVATLARLLPTAAGLLSALPPRRVLHPAHHPAPRLRRRRGPG